MVTLKDPKFYCVHVWAYQLNTSPLHKFWSHCEEARLIFSFLHMAAQYNISQLHTWIPQILAKSLHRLKISNKMPSFMHMYILSFPHTQKKEQSNYLIQFQKTI